jgi:hypothetical protein
VSFGTVVFSNTTATATQSVISGNNTFAGLTFSGPSSVGSRTYSFSSSQTINGTFSSTGTAGNRRVVIGSFTFPLAITLNVNGSTSLTDVDFDSIYVGGTSSPISGTRIGNLSNCAGITFSTPKTVYWVTVAGGNWVDNNWSTSIGGAASLDAFPLAQDTASIQNTGLNTAATITFSTSTLNWIGTLTCSSRTNTVTFSGTQGLEFYGNVTLSSAVTWSASGTWSFYALKQTQTIISAGRTIPALTIYNLDGAVELGDATQSGAVLVQRGLFKTNNYNLTCSSLDGNNRGEIALGSSTVTLSGSTAISATGTWTLTPGTSTINLTAADASISGAATFYNVNWTNTGNTAIVFNANNPTFNNVTITARATTGLVDVTLFGNISLSGTLTISGASAIRRFNVTSSTRGTQRTITANALSANDCDFRDIVIAGSATGTAPTRAGDCGNNSGITFPATKTVYWNLSGTQNWSATGWATSSGGSPAVDNFPLAQDTAVFNNTGAMGTVTINANWNIGTVDASARTSSASLGISTNQPKVYGSWTNPTSGLSYVISSSSDARLIFCGSGTQVLTGNGRPFEFTIQVQGVGTVELGSAIILQTNTSYLRLLSGTFDAKTYNITTSKVYIEGSTSLTVKMGSGLWTVSGTGDIWYFLNSSALLFYKETANITLSSTSTTARTFDSFGGSYNKLTIGGASGISTLTVSGESTWTEWASTKTVAHTINFEAIQTIGKWSITGTSGNVVTLGGSVPTGHVIAGSATTGINFLSMGSFALADTSPGEFYAGVNSTGTAGAPVYRTATPAARTLYWVGGTGNWSDTSKWSISSGGSGGSAIPTSLDDVIFDSSSNATAYTATINQTSRCNNLTINGPASGNVTLAGSSALIVHGNVTFPATGMTRTFTGPITLSGSTSGKVFTTNGISLASQLTLNGNNCEWALGSALSTSQDLTLRVGKIDTANYALSIASIAVDGPPQSLTLEFGSSTISMSGSVNIYHSSSVGSIRPNITITAGTSTIQLSGTNANFYGNNATWYNVSVTSTSTGFVSFSNGATFNDLTFAAPTVNYGANRRFLSGLFTINGTFTVNGGANATFRTLVEGDSSFQFATRRTLSCNAVNLTDVDFQHIEITGSAAPATGTRLGDRKNNSGITFTSKTVYVRATGSTNWSSTTAWSATDGGTADVTQFPLAQDTVIVPVSYPSSGSVITMDAQYAYGSIDMSARTTNTVTLSTGPSARQIYGNWINGTGTTIAGTETLEFVGRTTQTITSAGKTFTPTILVASVGGSVTIQDALTINKAGTALNVTHGTFDANNYSVSLTSSTGTFSSNVSSTRTVAIGSATWTISGSSTAWQVTTSTNLTVTGTGTLTFTSGSAKTLQMGSANYTNITVNNGGAGAFTMFLVGELKNISNTYKSTGATSITISNSFITLSSFTAEGEVGRILTLSGGNSPTLKYTDVSVIDLDYCNVSDIIALPGTTKWTATNNSINYGSFGIAFDVTIPVLPATAAFLMFMPM